MSQLPISLLVGGSKKIGSMLINRKQCRNILLTIKELTTRRNKNRNHHISLFPRNRVGIRASFSTLSFFKKMLMSILEFTKERGKRTSSELITEP